MIQYKAELVYLKKKQDFDDVTAGFKARAAEFR